MRFLSLLEFLRKHKRRQLARKGYTGTQKMRRKTSQAFGCRTHRRSRFLPVFVMVVVWATAVANLLYSPRYSSFNYLPGVQADEYLYSELTFEYEDINQTRLKRQQAASQVPPVYRIEQRTVQEALRRVDVFRAAVNQRVEQLNASAGGSVTAPAVPSAASGTYDEIGRAVAVLTAEDLRALESLFGDDSRWSFLRGLLGDRLMEGVARKADVTTGFDGTAVDRRIYLMDSLLRKRLTQLDQLWTLETVAVAVAQIVVDRFYPESGDGNELLARVLSVAITPNLVFDLEATDNTKALAAEQIPVAYKKVTAGDALLRPGQRITVEDLQRIQVYHRALAEIQTSSNSLPNLFLFSLLCLFLVLFTGYALFAFHPSLLNSNSQLIMIGIILIFQILASRLTGIALGVNYHLHALMPLALGAMLLSQLIGIRAAFVGSVFTCTVVCLQYGQSLELLFIGVFSSFAAAILMRRARRRSHAVRAGAVTGLVAFVIIVIFMFYGHISWEASLKLMPMMLLASVGSGVVSAIVSSYFLLPFFFEPFFGVTTDTSLLELSDLNHPLLKQLQMEAPGTYHHSQMVATLAEQAAEAIGANPLLARVASYFHDIGKLEHPDYFTENIWDGDPHAVLQPRMSSLVILNHVKEGIDLAIKYKLKKPIREAIAQHHGTSLVYYFYRRALALQERNRKRDEIDVGEHEYRYPGPKPMRKEIVIISIADACEAAARSLEKPTPQKVAALVDEIAMNRIRDGQFDEADLTLRELTKVKEAIVKTINTMFHGRIKYPEEKKDYEGDLFQAMENSRPETTAGISEGHRNGS